jgi:hypothetical protein
MIKNTDLTPNLTMSKNELSVDNIVHFVKNMCLTYSQLSYYPVGHPVVIRQMQKAWLELQAVFEKIGDVNISLANGKLLFLGLPVENRNPVIEKFANHFSELHVTSISFHKTLDVKEFAAFFKLFCQDSQLVNEMGGVAKLSKDENIQHISFNSAIYRVIESTEKIVNKSDVYQGHVSGDEKEKEEMMSHFLKQMLSLVGDQSTFLNEIKNNPEHLAEQIIRIVEKAGLNENIDREQMIEAMISNIQMITERITEKDYVDDSETQNTAEAMLELERQLRGKSKKLSSKTATLFIKRITDVVSTYSDKVKANMVLGEFIKNEQSLKSAEAMIKEIAPNINSGEKILKHIKEIMDSTGIEENELISHLEKNIKSKKTKTKKTVHKKFRSLASRIKTKLNSDFNDMDSNDRDHFIKYLDNLYTQETKHVVKEKTAVLNKKISHMKTTIDHVEQAFENTNIGFVVLDNDNKICFLKHEEELPFNLKIDQSLPDELLKLLNADNIVGSKLGKAEIMEVIRNDDGKIISLLYQFD